MGSRNDVLHQLARVLRAVADRVKVLSVALAEVKSGQLGGHIGLGHRYRTDLGPGTRY